MKNITIELSDKEYAILQIQIEEGFTNLNEFKNGFMSKYYLTIDIYKESLSDLEYYEFNENEMKIVMKYLKFTDKEFFNTNEKYYMKYLNKKTECLK